MVYYYFQSIKTCNMGKLVLEIKRTNLCQISNPRLVFADLPTV